MDKASLDSIKATIQTTGETLGSIVDVVDPQFHVAVVIGTAIAEQAPELVNDVQQWLANRKAGNPSPAEDHAIAEKIAALLAPEGPGLA